MGWVWTAEEGQPRRVRVRMARRVGRERRNWTRVKKTVRRVVTAVERIVVTRESGKVEPWYAWRAEEFSG